MSFGHVTVFSKTMAQIRPGLHQLVCLIALWQHCPSSAFLLTKSFCGKQLEPKFVEVPAGKLPLFARLSKKSTRAHSCFRPICSVQERGVKQVKIMAQGDIDQFRLFSTKGAKDHAKHLAEICEKADREQRFLTEEELNKLLHEPDIAAGMRRMLSRFQAEIPTVYKSIAADLDESHPDRTGELHHEEWSRWAQLVQYLLLSVRGDEHSNDDLQGIVDAVEALVDRLDLLHRSHQPPPPSSTRLFDKSINIHRRHHHQDYHFRVPSVTPPPPSTTILHPCTPDLWESGANSGRFFESERGRCRKL
jgi:hypothetical protein